MVNDSSEKHFYTWDSFLSLSVTAGMIWVVAGALSYAFDWRYPRWFPFVLALALSVTGDLAPRPGRPKAALGAGRWPLWILNGCLIYVTAVGGAVVTQGAAIAEETEERRQEAAAVTAEIAGLAETVASGSSRGETREAARRLALEASDARACLDAGDESCLERLRAMDMTEIFIVERGAEGVDPNVQDDLTNQLEQLGEVRVDASQAVGFTRLAVTPFVG